MNFVWIFVLIMLALLYVYRSSTSRIVSLASQVETLKNSAAANTMTPEDVDALFEKKMREFEQKRVEAVRQMREAHAKHAEAQGTANSPPFAVVPPAPGKPPAPVGLPSPPGATLPSPQTKPKPDAIIKLPSPAKPDKFEEVESEESKDKDIKPKDSKDEEPVDSKDEEPKLVEPDEHKDTETPVVDQPIIEKEVAKTEPAVRRRRTATKT